MNATPHRTDGPTSEPPEDGQAARPAETKDVPPARIPLGPDAAEGRGRRGGLPLGPLFGLLGAILGLVLLGTVLEAPMIAGGLFVVLALVVVFGLARKRRPPDAE